MKAVTVDSFDAAPGFRDDQAVPTAPSAGIVVRVRASSVNPVDNAIASGMLRGMVEHDFPVVLGRDYAGTVYETGADGGGYSVGDEVFGFLLHANPTVHDGSWAELIALTYGDVRSRRCPHHWTLPLRVSPPLAGVTALAAMDALALSEGETVLIVGATGGVGSFAVQLAARAGAGSSRLRSPKTPTTCVSSVSPSSSTATPTSSLPFGPPIPMASTRCSISSPTPPGSSTAR